MAVTTHLVAAPVAVAARPRSARVALVGNPNTGKTTLFNRLTGLRAKTANFPGTTLERRVGTMQVGARRVEIEDAEPLRRQIVAVRRRDRSAAGGA